MKNLSDTIGNQTRDLPVCIAVRQPTALQRIPGHTLYSSKYTTLDPIMNCI
jgi:hypothetical protein